MADTAPDYRIHRYRIPLVSDRPVVTMREGYHLLSVGPSRDGLNELDLWAVVDPAADPADVTLRVVGTGHSVVAFDDEWFRFLGTVPHRDGQLIFHVFELVARTKAADLPPHAMPRLTSED